MTPALRFAKTASDLSQALKRVRELESKVAGLEKRAEAEKFLVETMANSRAPLSLRPTSISDFLEKRALIENSNLEAAKLAVQMTSAGEKFEIGDPEDSRPLYSSLGSRADDDFVDYLLGSGQ